MAHGLLRALLLGMQVSDACQPCGKVPEICQKMLNDRGWDDIANVFCITTSKGLESNAHTLPDLIEHRAACTMTTVAELM